VFYFFSSRNFRLSEEKWTENKAVKNSRYQRKLEDKTACDIQHCGQVIRWMVSNVHQAAVLPECMEWRRGLTFCVYSLPYPRGAEQQTFSISGTIATGVSRPSAQPNQCPLTAWHSILSGKRRRLFAFYLR